MILAPLLARARGAGFVTYEQVNEAIPATVTAPEELGEPLARIQREGIEIIDEEKAEERGLNVGVSHKAGVEAGGNGVDPSEPLETIDTLASDTVRE